MSRYVQHDAASLATLVSCGSLDLSILNGIGRLADLQFQYLPRDQLRIDHQDPGP